MKKLIGKKSEFAIEYAIKTRVPYLMGNLRLWLGGMYVGYFNEDIMLSSAQHILMHLRGRINELNNEVFTTKKVEEIYNLVYSGKIDNGKYLLNLGDSFDDFSFFVFLRGNQINFVWKLHKEPFFDYPNYKNNINHKEIDISVFSEIVKSFQSI
ncbi:MAG: hypothetical protein PVH87_21260 [Desulfobacteraceae bacterium]|jgi:hypothetical protein